MKYWIWIIVILISMKSSAQIITTFAGTGSTVFSGEGVPATSAGLPGASGIAFDKQGNCYLADVVNSYRIRKVTANGIISTISGIGVAGYSGDGGPATAARLGGPGGIDLDTAGNVYFSDGPNNRVRKIDKSTGIISTIAGTGAGTYGGDGGAATLADLYNPQDVRCDTLGNIYIGAFYDNRIRKVDASGNINTIAGGGAGGLGDGGPATAAQLVAPWGVEIDDTGNVYLAQTAGTSTITNRIRKINTAGIITTIAGNGAWAYTGDGVPATSASMGARFITFDASGQLFISDYSNNRVYKVDHSGILHLVAGNGSSASAGDGGPATAASLWGPGPIAFDPCGNLYISDLGGRRIRKITFNPPTTPTVTIAGITTASVGATVTVDAAVTGAGSSYTIKWLNKGIQFATTTVPNVTYTKVAGTDTITARVVPAVTYCYDSTTSAPHMVSESTVSVSWLLQGAFSVYPNPGHSTLSISGGEVIKSVTITNLVGEVLINEQPDKEAIQINIAHLQPGMYLMRINAMYVQRFMKE
jgi:hypothetical protein